MGENHVLYSLSWTYHLKQSLLWSVLVRPYLLTNSQRHLSHVSCIILYVIFGQTP